MSEVYLAWKRWCWIRYDYVLTRQQYLSFANTRDSSAEFSTFHLASLAPGPAWLVHHLWRSTSNAEPSTVPFQ